MQQWKKQYIAGMENEGLKWKIQQIAGIGKCMSGKYRGDNVQKAVKTDKR